MNDSMSTISNAVGEVASTLITESTEKLSDYAYEYIGEENMKLSIFIGTFGGIILTAITAMILKIKDLREESINEI